MTRCFDWEAWYDRMPGADHDVLHVAGSCEVGSSSTELRLEPDNEGFVDNPELVVLRLFVDEAPVGDTMTDTKTVSTTVRETGIKHVTVRLPDATDVSIDVRDVH